MKRADLAAALAAVIGVPVLLIGQQLLLPRDHPPEPPPTPETRGFDGKLMSATEEALASHHPAATAYTVTVFLRRGDFKLAETWLRFGAAEQRYPSLMFLYGDFESRRGRKTAALRWFRLARSYGVRAGARPFVRAIDARLNAMGVKP